MSKFKAILIECRIATKKMKCDAFEMRMELGRDTTKMGDLERGIVVWARAWKGIVKDSEYVHYEFQDGAENFVFNSRKDMNRVMFQHKLYPDLMMAAIIDYRKTHKI